MIEHVGAPAGSRIAHIQALLGLVWRRVAGTYHLSRLAAATLAEPGFDITRLRKDRLPAAPASLAPAIRGALQLNAVAPRSPAPLGYDGDDDSTKRSSEND